MIPKFSISPGERPTGPITLEGWAEYLGYIKVINGAIRRQNSKRWKACHRENRRMRIEANEFNNKQMADRKKFMQNIRDKQMAFDAQPWWKRRISGDRPVMPLVPPPALMSHNWTRPFTVTELPTTIEDFLTWQLKQKKR